MTTTKPQATIRPAHPQEVEQINELIMRAKAHWGYDQSFLEACRPYLLLSPEEIEREFVYCAEVAGVLAGMSHLRVLSATEIDFDHLFVDPSFIGHGIGALLWQHGIDLARSLGARVVTLGADPNARPFYEHMGAVVVGEQPSPIIPERRNPLMRYTL